MSGQKCQIYDLSLTQLSLSECHDSVLPPHHLPQNVQMMVPQNHAIMCYECVCFSMFPTFLQKSGVDGKLDSLCC